MSKRLFIGNLSWNLSQEDLAAAFTDFGAENVLLPKDERDRSKGFGFVDVPDDQLQPAIDAMNGKELDGRAIIVNEARPKEERAPRGDHYAQSR